MPSSIFSSTAKSPDDEPASGAGVYELSFGDGGRAILRFGGEVRKGMAHIEWLAIGGHEIVE